MSAAWWRLGPLHNIQLSAGASLPIVLFLCWNIFYYAYNSYQTLDYYRCGVFLLTFIFKREQSRGHHLSPYTFMGYMPQSCIQVPPCFPILSLPQKKESRAEGEVGGMELCLCKRPGSLGLFRPTKASRGRYRTGLQHCTGCRKAAHGTSHTSPSCKPQQH